MPMAIRVLVINGPNLNLLGSRAPHIYGTATLADVEQMCTSVAEGLGLQIDFFQSNSEGALIDRIQQTRAGGESSAEAILINPAAYSHTSIALRDALEAVERHVVEVHISNIHARDEFRHHSYISGIANSVIAGAGIHGYELGLRLIAAQNLS